MTQSRREFLKKTGCALSMAALATQAEHFGLMSTLAQTVDDRNYSEVPGGLPRSGLYISKRRE